MRKKVGSIWEFPEPLDEFAFYLNFHAINGWVFQNHSDCLASAIASGINAAYNRKRGNSLFTTKEIVNFMKRHAESALQDIFNHLITNFPLSDSFPLDSLKFFMVFSLHFSFLFLKNSEKYFLPLCTASSVE